MTETRPKDTTTSSPTTVSQVQDDVRPSPYTTLGECLVPVYYMANGFLGVVQQRTLKDISSQVNFSDLESVGESFTNRTEIWVDYFGGFVACLVVGFVLVVVSPVVGCCVCVCRLRGQCGADVELTDGKRSRCQRIACGVFLGFLILLLLLGGACAFIANSLAYEQTNDDGALKSVRTSVETMDSYKDATMDELRDTVLNGFNRTKNDIFNKLDSLALNTGEILGNITRAGPLLQTLRSLTLSLLTLAINLEDVNKTTAYLTKLGGNLSIELSALRTDINKDLDNCSLSACDEVRAMATRLTPVANFSQLEDISLVVNTIKNVIANDIISKVHEGQESFDNITKVVHKDVAELVDDIKKRTNMLQMELGQCAHNIHNQIKSYNLSSIQDSIQRIQPYVEEYGAYRFYVCLALTSIFALVMLLALSALSYGTCGDRPHSDAICCNTAVGSRFLVAGIAFVFIFYGLLMLVAMATFLVGGVAHTELCRHLAEPEDSKTIDIVEDIVSQALNTSFPMRVYLKNCRANQAIYSALDLDNLLHINISTILDLKNYGIYEVFAEVRRLNFQLGKVSILNRDAQDLLELVSTSLSWLNLTMFYSEVTKELVGVDLDLFSHELAQSAVNISSQDPNVSAVFMNHAGRMAHIANSTIASMEYQRTHLWLTLDQLIPISQLPLIIQDLINNTLQTQNSINLHGSSQVKDIVMGLSDSVLKDLQGLSASVETNVRSEVGKCRPLYSAIVRSTDAVCFRFLNPFNAFWFSYGFSLFILLIFLIVAFPLVGLYRKQDPFEAEALFYMYDSNFHVPRQGMVADLKPIDIVPIYTHNRRRPNPKQNKILPVLPTPDKSEC